mgnify:CR=1 FL=1
MSDRVGTEDMGNWERTARRFDAAILQEAGWGAEGKCVRGCNDRVRAC